ncbi:MAG: helix-turn-helix domain-containing protein [Roseburia sp.]|nr:helix-turn-helix domain-containing protein [Roseburia sp.]
MDSKKIGVFIANKRKQKQMTQKQLGEALGCSDKLISKWECGNGLPDVSMMLPLCELLEINVNELLSGEHLTQDSYCGKAEENMMNLMKTNENQRKRTIKSMVSGIVLIVGFMLVLILFSQFNVSPVPLVAYLDGISVLEVLVILILSLWYAGHLKDFKNAFVFAFSGTDKPGALQNAIAAVALAEKSLIVGGAFSSIFNIIYILAYMAGESVTFYANIAVSLLTLFYGVFAAMLLMPIKSRLERKLLNI